MALPVLCAIVALTNACGTVAVDPHGARVVSYVPVGGEEVFFSSETGTGGVPLCWPWFGGLGPSSDSRRHGVARYSDFKVMERKNHSYCDKELVLRLDSNDETRRHFPHDFALTVSVRLNDRLTIKMTGENTGSDSFKVTEAFHPYFAVADSQTCRVEGESSPECRLVDATGGNGFSFYDEGGAGRRVWRPNAESHLSKTVSAIAPDDWKKFICVEYGTFDKERSYTLKPGESHSLVCTVNLSLTHGNARPIDLQAKIDAAAASGGGRVVVPAGEWLSKCAIHLKSNVELHLEEGALLTFPDDPKACLPVVRTSFGGIEYRGLSPLVYAYYATNVAVTGKGTIAPRMAFWRGWFEREQCPDVLENMRRFYAWGENDVPVEERRFKDPATARLRPSCVEFEQCRNVRLEDFKVRESPLWCVHLHRCKDVVVRGIDIRARGHNNDGIDVNASRNVLVEDCVLDQGDDGFVIKSGRDRDGRRVGVPCENVEIRNCLIKGGHTLLAVGSEISGGIRNISLHDCRVEGDLGVMAIVKTSDRKGAFVENVSVSNVVVRGNVGKVVAVATDVDYQWGKYPARERIVTRIDGFRVENVEADSAKMVYSLMGDKRLPAKNVMLKDIRVRKCEGESRAENVEFTVLQLTSPATAEVESEVKSQAVRQPDPKPVTKEDASPKTGDTKTLTLSDGVTMEMIYCGPGSFMMGSPTSEDGHENDETQHRVTLTKGFWLGKYEVTQKQWQSIMGYNPSLFKSDDRPVEGVSWEDCRKFISGVSAEARRQLGGEARLPTEAEWEYACRAGTTTAYFWGDALNGDKANCDGNFPCGTAVKGRYKEKTTPVGSYSANAWGFYDMHGNVSEWCCDWYGENYYKNSPSTDPQGPATGDNHAIFGNTRVLRGGSWGFYARHSRSANRDSSHSDYRFCNIGFRLCCSAQP